MHDRDAMHGRISLSRKLEKLYTLRSSGRINFDDGSFFHDLLSDLGDPHLKLPPVVHVAGTNGKGSTIAMLCALLEKSGKSVHVYTSPHLIEFNERIVLGGDVVSDDVLERALDYVLEVNDDRPCTFFEITTALAFYLFSKYVADFLLLETGLGGRLDCTNVVPDPVLTIITAIGLDHQEFLGDDIASIAVEKSGIIKGGAPCVISQQDIEFVNEVMDVVAQKTQRKNVELIEVHDVWHRALPNLVGHHQIENFNTALTAFGQLGLSLSDDELNDVVQHVRWRGRMERIYCAALPETCQLWFDGGHNEQAAKAVADSVADFDDLSLVVGLSGQRDPKSFLEPFSDKVYGVFIVPIDGVSGVCVDDIKVVALGLGFKQVIICDSVEHGVLSASKLSKNILVSGSLYLYKDIISI